MERHSKNSIALVCGAVLLVSLIGQTAQADLIGTANLADAYQVDSGPESLVVHYDVSFSAGVYTYSYNVYNPPGDVQLPGSANPGQPEIFDQFAVAFNTTLPGAYVPLSVSGGIYQQVNTFGIVWYLYPVINAGSYSGALSFQSYLPPTWNDASASDANPPSPWSSTPDGQPVPVPGLSVPDSMNTMALLAGVLLLLPFQSVLQRKAVLARSR